MYLPFWHQSQHSPAFHEQKWVIVFWWLLVKLLDFGNLIIFTSTGFIQITYVCKHPSKLKTQNIVQWTILDATQHWEPKFCKNIFDGSPKYSVFLTCVFPRVLACIQPCFTNFTNSSSLKCCTSLSFGWWNLLLGGCHRLIFYLHARVANHMCIHDHDQFVYTRATLRSTKV